MGPKKIASTVLSLEEEAICVAFRKHTLLPLDACLYVMQSRTPHLIRSSLHRCFQRHEIRRLPELKTKSRRKRHSRAILSAISHIDIAEVRTEEGRLDLFVAIDRTSKFAYVERPKKMEKWRPRSF